MEEPTVAHEPEASLDWARAEILKKAREISQLLTQTEDLRRFQEAERAYLNDAWIQETLRRQHEIRVALSLQPADAGDALTRDLSEQVDYYTESLEGNPRYVEYQAARAKVNRFLTAVMTVASHPVTGEGPAGGGGCSGRCSPGGCSV